MKKEISQIINGKRVIVKKPELLAPAGNLEKLKTAVIYGADAVFIGGKEFSLRSLASNFSLDDIKEAVEFAHAHGSAVHITTNIVMHENNLEGLENYLKAYINPFEMMGTALLIVGIMLLGSSIYAFALRSKIANRLFKMGLATLFVGGFMIFDVMMVYLMDELLVVKTYGSQLCLMLAVYFLGIIICDGIKGKHKNVAEIAMIISGSINVLLILLAVTGKVLLYDTRIIWECSQLVVSIILIICFILAVKNIKKNTIRKAEKRGKRKRIIHTKFSVFPKTQRTKKSKKLTASLFANIIRINTLTIPLRTLRRKK